MPPPRVAPTPPRGNGVGVVLVGAAAEGASKSSPSNPKSKSAAAAAAGFFSAALATGVVFCASGSFVPHSCQRNVSSRYNEAFNASLIAPASLSSSSSSNNNNNTRRYQTELGSILQLSTTVCMRGVCALSDPSDLAMSSTRQCNHNILTDQLMQNTYIQCVTK
jgi:hypothetical protein